MNDRAAADSPTDPRPGMGLRPVINVSGTVTVLGASIVAPDVAAATTPFLSQFVEIGDLQRAASAVIAKACGAEAGYVTACASSGITLAVAGAMTGSDLAAIERLPDTTGLKNEVVVQTGHLVNYGAPVEQAVRLSGARVVAFGAATEAHAYQLAGAITPRTAAALYVVSHHTVGYGQIPLAEFVATCRGKGVPVIVDAAAQYDLKAFIAAGADIAIYSAHKFLGGLTAGIVAGKRGLVRAAYLQNQGIGRGMKVGKEGIVGAMAALRAWEQRDRLAERAAQDRHLALWQERLANMPGIGASVLPDPSGNPVSRLKIEVDPAKANITAWDLADALAAGDPPIMVRDYEADAGYILLDPTCLHPGEAQIVAARLAEECQRARAGKPKRTPFAERNRRRLAKLLNWPD
ncbi:MAG: aminotransferase class V-fold PLP-dependent enzyme [Rhodospirillales bacterium]